MNLQTQERPVNRAHLIHGAALLHLVTANFSRCWSETATYLGMIFLLKNKILEYVKTFRICIQWD